MLYLHLDLAPYRARALASPAPVACSGTLELVAEVGVKFQAYWDADGKWYTVTIKSLDEAKGKTTIKYSDRKTESINVSVLPRGHSPLSLPPSLPASLHIWTHLRPP